MSLYIVITPFFPTDSSFRGSYIYDQVRAIERTHRFSKIMVFHPTTLWNYRNSYVYEGVEVHYFPCLQMPSYILNGLTNKLNQWLFVRRIKKMGIVADSIEVAHAHVSGFAACALALKKLNPRIKTFVQHHDRDPFTIRNGKWADKRWNLYFRAIQNRKLFNEVDCHVSISKVVEDNLLSFPRPGKYEIYPSYLRVLQKVNKLQPIEPRKSLVLYNGVDTSKFYPLKSTESDKSFTIGCIANFVELKDQMTLIKAVELLIEQTKIPQIYVSFIGSGPLLHSCQQYVEMHGLSEYISFGEEISHHKLLEYYNTLDLFVLPSCYEGFGCVYTEAYACGVPFMACKHQGAAECIENSDADKWLIEPHDFKQLAYLIEQYYAYRYPQKLSETYDIDILIKQFLQQVDSL